ncbi:MAG: cysteine hydrolase family protein [Syntrophobacteraceae bacterium]
MKYTNPDLSNSALVTIDVQRDFSLPGSPAEIPGTVNIVPYIVKLLKAYRASGRPIVHIVRLYLSDGSNVDLCRREFIQSGKELVRPGSAGAELVQKLLPTADIKLNCPHLLGGGTQTLGPGEVVIYKPRWGAFFGTPLQDHLDGLLVNTLVVCGCNFPNCPRTTIYEASERDFRIVLVEEAVSGIYQQGKDELRNIGVHLWSTEILIKRLNAECRVPGDALIAL